MRLELAETVSHLRAVAFDGVLALAHPVERFQPGLKQEPSGTCRYLTSIAIYLAPQKSPRRAGY